jgi:hypothetical protein
MERHQAQHGEEDQMDGNEQMKGGHYGRLLAMTAAAFLVMYGLMYSMVDRFGDVYNNVNQAYMAGLMAAPMVIIELALMWNMYPKRGFNVALLGIAAIAGVTFFFLIRQQVAVGDREFVKSMIPHHSAAILMCRQAPITDGELRNLCNGRNGIVETQDREIRQMKAILQRLSDR